MTDTTMAGFGYKTGWLATRGGDLATVLDVLGGRAIGSIGWQAGVRRAYDEEDIVIATPPLAGAGNGDWILVAGWWVASNYASIDVAALSASLDAEVQLFVTHRVAELHRWDRAVGGRRVRSFEYLGETGEVLRWRGEPDDVELAIGLPRAFEHDTAAALTDWPTPVGEGDVMRVAAAWSIDPTTLDGRPAPGELTVAQMPPRPTHRDAVTP